MYSDRELLELAVKAAGYVVGPDAHIPSGGIWLLESDGDRPWSPLTNDGDALRLAMKLGMTVCVDIDDGVTRMRNQYLELILLCRHETRGVDAATRRAIVRAAAAIGEAMK
jgi:hypothetical protein